MKIAILISGQPRNIHVGYESLKKFYLDKYDCDIFVHNWLDTKFSLSVYGDIIKAFNPKKIFYEEQIIFDDKGIRDQHWGVLLQNIISQYYSIYATNELKKLYEKQKNFTYDFIIRMRSDLKIERPIEIEKIEPGKLAIYNWTQLQYNDIGSSDVFAIGPSNLMDIYCNLYNKVLYYLNEDTSYNIRDPKMRQEYILNHHLKTANKIPIQIFWHGDQTDPSFYLIR